MVSSTTPYILFHLYYFKMQAKHLKLYLFSTLLPTSFIILLAHYPKALIFNSTSINLLNLHLSFYITLYLIKKVVLDLLKKQAHHSFFLYQN